MMSSSPYGFSCYPVPKKVLWKEGTDCCSWDGVTCNMQTGHVIGLDLGCSMLYGTLHSNSTLFSLQHLQKLDLSSNDFNRSVISSSFGQFLHLTHLNLTSSNFAGQVPPEISHLSRLVSLDLSSNSEELMLEPISFDKLAQNLTQLRELYLGGVNMSLVVPSSLMNLSSSLSSLQLWYSGLKGELPGLLGNLTQLIELGLADSQLVGQIPFSFGKLKQLEYLDLGYNNFIGPIPDVFINQTQLAWLDLSGNSFLGKILNAFFNLAQLTSLDLTNNRFDGQIPDSFSNLTQLTLLDLSNNRFDGQISFSFRNLKKLDILRLSFNNFCDKISDGFFNLKQLSWFDLSNNRFDGQIPNGFFNLIQLIFLDLSHNILIGRIPSQISRLSGLNSLLLSNNQLIGSIPSQISRLSGLNSLDLSHNLLNGTIRSTLFSMPSLQALFLHNNLLYGQIIFKLEQLRALMLSSNDKLTGNISSVICELKFLEILDLSNNGFSGFIPQCLGNFSDGLLVLHLGANNLHGNIPSIYSEENSLRYLNFNGNQLKGVIPPSIINCVNLEFLDLGNNMIDDTFPSFLETLPQLEVVVLRSNKLHGSLKGPTVKDSFSKLQIFDLSNNSLSGPLPTEYFNNFKAMMSVDEDMDYFSQFQIALTTLDLSCNKFTGKIPESLGKLKSLIQLNLSHNSLICYIQPSLGNLTNLESLDLTSNLIAGRIPPQLVDLTFLQVLNLLYNQLEGPIPQGKQFNTFENGSYEGNLGLCGFPLQAKCNKGEGKQQPPSNFKKEDSMFEEGFGWKAVAMGYGCGFVFGVSIGYVVFRARKPAWFLKMVEDSAHQNAKRLRRKNAPRNGGRRY
ncbi:Cf-4/9 disease resistance-like family protein [Populus alba x Populus x berolinensis]|uniref:Cf-4/9 disease resistance-like family protein n=1 Tax=Populus alba x Populus x berolinensis TaxID=444605 RepID=A0AAD6Q792_9ROSI|nr:Cf-4/9 disease resistance-like family protein [Populus alba x Populus x berolinensis]